MDIEEGRNIEDNHDDSYNNISDPNKEGRAGRSFLVEKRSECKNIVEARIAEKRQEDNIRILGNLFNGKQLGITNLDEQKSCHNTKKSDYSPGLCIILNGKLIKLQQLYQ